MINASCRSGETYELHTNWSCNSMQKYGGVVACFLTAAATGLISPAYVNLWLYFPHSSSKKTNSQHITNLALLIFITMFKDLLKTNARSYRCGKKANTILVHESKY